MKPNWETSSHANIISNLLCSVFTDTLEVPLLPGYLEPLRSGPYGALQTYSPNRLEQKIHNQSPVIMGGAREGLAGAPAPPRKTKAPP